MKLSIKERLLMMQLLPEQGSISKMILARGITKKIEISSDEAHNIGMTDTPEGNIIWDVKKEKPSECDFNPSEIELLKESVNIADKAEKITHDNLDLAIRIKELKTES